MLHKFLLLTLAASYATANISPSLSRRLEVNPVATPTAAPTPATTPTAAPTPATTTTAAPTPATTTTAAPTPATTAAMTAKPVETCQSFQNNVDFKGFDLKSTSQSTADACCADCAAAPGCKMFVWTDFEGGTCWLKHTIGVNSTLSGAKAGFLSTKSSSSCGPQKINVDYPGNDINATQRATPDLCCDVCKNTTGCRNYVWTNFQGGTCWLKSAQGEAKEEDGAVAVSLAYHIWSAINRDHPMDRRVVALHEQYDRSLLDQFYSDVLLPCWHLRWLTRKLQRLCKTPLTWSRGKKSIGPGVQKKDGIMRGLIYTQVSISGQALIFVTRTAGINTWFFAEKPCNLLLFAFVVAQVAASVIGYFGFQGYPSDRVAVFGCGGPYLGIALIKFAVNYVLHKNTYTQTAFTSRINAGHPSMTHNKVTSVARSIRASSTVP
ncbi:hypothetical protein AC1031_010839 [Aphanomyces cochlioides]|nr:hypothetical protein AC1031_010839 [Aphanomyces cochlioides]